MVGTVEQPYKPTTLEEKLDRKNEMKARRTLLITLLNKDQLKFQSYQDAKLLMEAIQKRYGGNKESKKVQRILLKQQYENFTASSSKTLDQTFDSTNSTNEADNIAYEVSATHIQGNIINSTSVDNVSDAVICAFLASQPNSPQLSRDDLKQIDPDDIEEIDLKWKMAMLTIKARRAPNNQENKGREYGRKTVPVENPTKNALIAQDEIRGYDWSYQAEEEHPTNFALMALTSSDISFNSNSEVILVLKHV
nr:ribonuclease H-like domain-containing protein [Tanacetum cinerariifolium]